MSASEARPVRQPDAAELAARLRPVMAGLEGARTQALQRRALGRKIAFAVMAGGGLAAFAIGASGEGRILPGLFVLAGSIVLGAAVWQLAAGKRIREYQHHFKSTVLRNAVQAVAPGVEYLPGDCIPQNLFESSGLFDSRIDRYTGEDRFHGKVGATKISFSEIHVERKETTSDGKTQQTRWVTVFQGIFMIADFHKDFRGTVLIEPDFAEATLGFLGRKLQNFSGDLVRLENPEFEKAFKVRASDPVEARYLLTPDMQERFLKLRESWSPQIRAAFRESSLILALPKSENWFEIDLSIPADHPGHLNRFLGELLPLLFIPKQLDLDTRLWTKE